MPPKFYTSGNSLNGGEISELLFNREDITKYKSSCRVLENAFPLVEGGAKKMPGTYFAGHTQNNLAPARLVPFQFSTDQGAVLELWCNTYMVAYHSRYMDTRAGREHGYTYCPDYPLYSS